MLNKSNVDDIKNMCTRYSTHWYIGLACYPSTWIVFDYRKLAVEKFTGGLYVRSLTL